MRSIVGVGMTPPKVDGAPKPTSSVMIRRMLGAPAGGTIRGGHHDFDRSAFRLIVPPNGRSGAGSTSPGIVRVPSGAPIFAPIGSCIGVEPAALAAPLVCAAALPGSQAPPTAVASAAFAVDKNNCRRFILGSSDCPVLRLTQHTAEADVAGRGVERLRVARRRAVPLTVIRRAKIRAALDHFARDARPVLG